MLSLSYQLLISVLVLNAIVYFLLSARAKKNGTANTYSIAIFFLTSVPTVILHTVIYFGLIFFQFNDNVANKYSEHPIGIDTYVLIQPAKLFADKGAPDYIGSEIKDLSLKIGDTVYTTASYQQGDFVSGKDFSRIIYKGRRCWFASDGVTQSLFYYTYANQPLSFDADAEQNEKYWERAKTYMKLYEDDRKDENMYGVIYNDTMMNVQWDNATYGGHLDIKRKPLGARYRYTISGGLGKGQENCKVANVKDRFTNSPGNQNAFAYYVTHGNFYKDTYKPE